MSNIHFRAKRTDGIGWVRGFLIKTPITAEFKTEHPVFDEGEGRYCIVTDFGVAHEINIKTVGMASGLYDNNGLMIYEGDICKDYEAGKVGKVLLKGGSFFFHWENIIEQLFDASYSIDVIGNIHDNANFLK